MDKDKAAAFIEEKRKEKGLTQQQVADRAGINIRQYQRLESNERSLAGTSFRIGLNICRALKIDPMYYCEVWGQPEGGKSQGT